MNTRPAIAESNLSTGKKGRLLRIFHKSGLRNGTALLLPYGLGFGPGFEISPGNPATGSPTDAIRFAFEANVSGMVLPVDLADKFYWDYAGELPLILTLNDAGGATDAEPHSRATVADAVRLGADGVGYLLYTDAPVQSAHLPHYEKVRVDAERFGMPLFVWALPRGRTVEEMGGADSLFAVDYATRAAVRLGADVMIVRFPHPERQPQRQIGPAPRIYLQEAMGSVVRSAGQTLVIASSGPDATDEAMVAETRHAMRAGAGGIMFDRPLPARSHQAWLPLIRQLNQALAVYCS